jgi:Na+/citrate or Na+/malate symporter
MTMDTLPITHIAQVISESIAPAFMLGAVSGFTAVLTTRLNRIIDRCRSLAESDKSQGDPDKGGAAAHALNTRANLINRALIFAVASALATTLLMIVAFVDAFFELPHEKGVAFIVVVSFLLFAAALVYFGREIRIALTDPNNFD